MALEKMKNTQRLYDLQMCTDELYQYAAREGFTSGADDEQAMQELIFFMMGKAVGENIAEAKYLMGRYIFVTSGAQEDGAIASQLLSEAALQGYGPAQEFLRSIGVSEETTTPDDEVDWENVLYEAEIGNPEAQYQLALSYMDIVDGKEKDHALAMEWMERAAKNGHEMAGEQFRMWSYVDRLKAQGEIPEDADFMDVMQIIIAKAESGDEEAQSVL